MISVISWFIVSVSMVTLLRMYFRAKYIFILFSVFFVTSIWRLIGAYQIDFTESIESVELGSEVGGTYGLYAAIMSMFFLIALFVINVYFSRRRTGFLIEALRRNSIPLKVNGIQVEYIFIIILLVVYISVIFETVNIGIYPLIDNIPRWQYSREIAGVLTKNIFLYFVGFGAFLHGYLYVFFTQKKRCNSCKNIVFLLIVMQQFIFISQGNKFTTPFFVLLITFSIISISYIKKSNKWSALNSLKTYLIVTLLLLFFIFLMYVVFIINRGYSNEYLIDFLYQRVFIAPNQLNFDAVQRAFTLPSEHIMAFYYLFVDKLPMDSNPSVNYLMFKSIGSSVLTINTSFTDAYPGVFIELGGVVGGGVLAIVFAVIYVLSAYRMMLYVALGELLPATFFFFIFQASMQLHNQGQFPTILLFVKLFIVYVSILLVKRKTLKPKLN
jgi:hypothetical protein